MWHNKKPRYARDVTGLNKNNQPVLWGYQVEDYTSKEEALKYLELLDPTTNSFTFQTFDDNYDRKDRSLAKLMHGTLEEHWDTLVEYSNNGAGVFIAVNRTDLKGRRKSNMVGTRACWIEDDGDATAPPIKPNFIVESSKDHFHSYILHALPEKDFQHIQNALIKDFHSDANARDYTRVLRLPGFPHQKVRKEKGLTGTKFMVHITENNDLPAYQKDTLAEHFRFNGHKTPSEKPKALPVKPTHKNLLLVEEALNHIPCTERESWVSVSHAVKLLGQEAFPLWDAWSRKSHNYDAAGNMEVWASISPERTDIASVFRKAGEHGMRHNRVEECILLIASDELTPKALPDAEPETVKNYFKDAAMTAEIANGIGRERWLYQDVIMAEALTIVCAPPNGGKTAILYDIAQQIGRRGVDNVFYISADSNPQDIKRMYPMAVASNIELLAPDFRDDESMDTIVNRFRTLLAAKANLTGMVFFIDTFKKMVDMINKAAVKDILTLMRQMVSRGATVILVAHTNKYKGEDGTLVYEGTGDVRADVDNLIYFYPDKDPTTLDLTVTTAPDKVRGIFVPVTFVVDGFTREVTQERETIDTKEIHAHRVQRGKDSDMIEVINQAIDAGCTTQTEIVKWAVAGGGTRRGSREVLARYSVEQGTARLPMDDYQWEYAVHARNTHSYTKISW